MVECEVSAAEAGPRAAMKPGVMFLGLVRAGELIRFDDPRAGELVAGDRLIELRGEPPGA